jgi:hypothetical protein
MEAVQQVYAFHVLNSLLMFEEVPPTVSDVHSRRDASIHSGLPY